MARVADGLTGARGEHRRRRRAVDLEGVHDPGAERVGQRRERRGVAQGADLGSGHAVHGRRTTPIAQAVLWTMHRPEQAAGMRYLRRGAAGPEIRLPPDVGPYLSRARLGGAGRDRPTGTLSKEYTVNLYADPMFVQVEIDRRFELFGVADQHPQPRPAPRDLPARPLGAHPLARSSTARCDALRPTRPDGRRRRSPAPPVTAVRVGAGCHDRGRAAPYPHRSRRSPRGARPRRRRPGLGRRRRRGRPARR